MIKCIKCFANDNKVVEGEFIIHGMSLCGDHFVFYMSKPPLD